MHLSRLQSPSEAISTRPHHALAPRSHRQVKPAPVMRASPQLENPRQLASHPRPRFGRNHLDQPTRPHRESATSLPAHAHNNLARARRRTTTVLAVFYLALCRPKSRPKNEGLAAFAAASSAAVHVQRCSRGTPAITCLTCWPHPAQVIFLQFQQLLRVHINCSRFD